MYRATLLFCKRNNVSIFWKDAKQNYFVCFLFSFANCHSQLFEQEISLVSMPTFTFELSPGIKMSQSMWRYLWMVPFLVYELFQVNFDRDHVVKFIKQMTFFAVSCFWFMVIFSYLNESNLLHKPFIPRNWIFLLNIRIWLKVLHLYIRNTRSNKLRNRTRHYWCYRLFITKCYRIYNWDDKFLCSSQFPYMRYVYKYNVTTVMMYLCCM